MSSKDTNSLHWILGAALLLIGLFVVVSLVGVNSQADSVNTQTNITNHSPTVEDVFVNDAQWVFSPGFGGGSITVVPGGQRDVWINGNVRDQNGRGDILAVKGQFYKTTAGDTCTPDSNDCYAESSCSTQNDTEGDLEVLEYSCLMSLDYWTDSTSTGGASPSTDWTVKVEVVDNAMTTGSDSSVTKEIETTLALTIPTTINFGTLTKGQSTTSANNQHQVIGQNANDEGDVEVSSAADMTCTNTGTIPVANQEWSLTDVDHSDPAGTDLSGSAADTNLGVAYKTTGDVSETLYWNIELPASNISGTCTGTTTVTAIAS